MTDLSRTTFSNAFSLMKICISVISSLMFVPNGAITNMQALVQIMASPIRRQADAYIRHSASIKCYLLKVA